MALPNGMCRYLDQESNLCRIYKSRPLFCRVDESYDKFFSKEMSREEFYQRNLEICRSLRQQKSLETVSAAHGERRNHG